jgi:hypothetical protein
VVKRETKRPVIIHKNTVGEKVDWQRATAKRTTSQPYRSEEKRGVGKRISAIARREERKG